MTIPVCPDGTRSEVSFTSAAFSPKMARRRRSSGASSVSLFGVILPTRISPGFTSAPTRMTPSGPRSLSASSPTFGMSRVISSGPSLVSRAPTSNSLDVDRGVDVVLHHALGDRDGILKVVAVPRHERDEHVATEGEFAVVGARSVGENCPFLTLSPRARAASG